ncbi:MAG: AbrB/MazE/SpoVT family DNA-binding domain-containing protein [Bacillota bacterium]
MAEFEVVKVTSKGQMTLPVKVRKVLSIKEGEYLAVYVEGEDIILRRVSPFRKASREDNIFRLIGRGEGPADLAEEHDRYLGL